MWWLERRFEGFQRNFQATGQVLGERFEIAIVDPIEPADPAEDEPSDDQVSILSCAKTRPF